MKIILRPSINDLVMKLTARYYYPFLGAGGLGSNAHIFSVLCDNFLTGFVEIIYSNENSLAICIFPWYCGKGIAKKAINLLFDAVHINRIKYVVNRSNYPSLCLLKSVNGGITEKLNDELMIGYINKNSKVDQKDEEFLQEILNESKSLYKSYELKLKERDTVLFELKNTVNAMDFINNDMFPNCDIYKI